MNAEPMKGVLLTGELLKRGYSPNEISRQRRRGERRTVRRGAVASGVGPEPTALERHRELIDATLPQLRADAALSYVSAAVLHGLPVGTADLSRVHLTRPRTTNGGGKRRTFLALHAQPLASADVTMLDGIPVTSLERTVFDLARAWPLDQAVAAGDRAMAIGLATELLVEMLERGIQWAGARQAHRVLEFLDPRAESPGESISRVRLDDFGLPAPVLQLPLVLRGGQTAYADFAWPELGTIGEFDGLVKYGALLRPGETAADAVIREKLREDRIRELGWQVVRWIWADLAAFGPVRHQLLAAFARGHRIS